MPFELPYHLQFRSIISTIGPMDILDIFIVAVILYKVCVMLQDTRAITLVKGILVLGCDDGLQLAGATRHLLAFAKAVTLLFVAPADRLPAGLRRALEHLGQGKFLGPSVLLDDEEAQSVVRELAKAVKVMSSQQDGCADRHRAQHGPQRHQRDGHPDRRPHHGGFSLERLHRTRRCGMARPSLRGKRLIAAGCLLPLTENRSLSTELGTAIGLSEQCDALVVVVSEETGTISVAENGRMVRHLDTEKLKNILWPAFTSPQKGLKDLIRNWRKKK